MPTKNAMPLMMEHARRVKSSGAGKAARSVTKSGSNGQAYAAVKAVKNAPSTKNWVRIGRCVAPSALRRPISRVRSVTETSMMLMMPMRRERA